LIHLASAADVCLEEVDDEVDDVGADEGIIELAALRAVGGQELTFQQTIRILAFVASSKRSEGCRKSRLEVAEVDGTSRCFDDFRSADLLDDEKKMNHIVSF